MDLGIKYKTLKLLVRKHEENLWDLDLAEKI